MLDEPDIGIGALFLFCDFVLVQVNCGFPFDAQKAGS
jgi:hypothetical protein